MGNLQGASILGFAHHSLVQAHHSFFEKNHEKTWGRYNLPTPWPSPFSCPSQIGRSGQEFEVFASRRGAPSPDGINPWKVYAWPGILVHSVEDPTILLGRYMAEVIPNISIKEAPTILWVDQFPLEHVIQLFFQPNAESEFPNRLQIS